MRVLVTGAGGQLGFDVCRELDRRRIENKGVDVEDFDISDLEAVEQYNCRTLPQGYLSDEFM